MTTDSQLKERLLSIMTTNTGNTENTEQKFVMKVEGLSLTIKGLIAILSKADPYGMIHEFHKAIRKGEDIYKYGKNFGRFRYRGTLEEDLYLCSSYMEVNDFQRLIEALIYIPKFAHRLYDFVDIIKTLKSHEEHKNAYIQVLIEFVIYCDKNFDTLPHEMKQTLCKTIVDTEKYVSIPDFYYLDKLGLYKERNLLIVIQGLRKKIVSYLIHNYRRGQIYTIKNLLRTDISAKNGSFIIKERKPQLTDEEAYSILVKITSYCELVILTRIHPSFENEEYQKEFIRRSDIIRSRKMLKKLKASA